MTNGPMSPEPMEMPLEECPEYVLARAAVDAVQKKVGIGDTRALQRILAVCLIEGVEFTREETRRYHDDCAQAEAERETDERLGK